MRDALLNPFEGVPTVAPFFGIDVEITAREAEFWLGRCAAIRVAANASISAASKDSGGSVTTDSYSASFDDVYYCPRDAALNPSTEFHQAYGRKRYGNVLGSGISVERIEPFTPPPGSTVTAALLTVNWGANIYHDPSRPITEGWFMTFDAGFPVLFIPNTSIPVGAQFSLFAQPQSVPFPGSIVIEAVDPVWGTKYRHDFEVFWSGELYTGATAPDPGCIGLTSGDANIFIEPAAYYEWKDGGGPTYDSTTGARLRPS